MRLILLHIIFLFAAVIANAQLPGNSHNKNIISGQVIDSAFKNPLEYATITLYRQNNENAIDGTITDRQGEFILNNIPSGAYRIVVEFIGYSSYTRNITLEQKEGTLILDSIALIKKIVQLKSVTITAEKPIIENKIDKLVFNAEKDITSQTGVATDVLKKVPMVSFDVDGNVQLAGSAGIKFLINGKPSVIFGANITEVLQSLPASQIQSIEVITNPGAKYDAQGMAGIINIIVKKNTSHGVNGNISLTAGTRNENGSFNFNMRKGNFGLNVYVSGNTRLPNDIFTSSDRTTFDTAENTNALLHQDGSSRYRRYGMETGIGFDWTYNKKNSFTGSLNYDDFNNMGKGSTNQQQTIKQAGGAGNILSDISSVNYRNSTIREHGFETNLEYTRTFDKEDQELNMSVTNSFDHNFASASNYQKLLPRDSLYEGTQSSNPGDEKETEIAVDYTQPIKEDVMLGLGGKMIFYDFKNTSTVYSFQPDLKSYNFDSSLSNYLDYHQNVYAFYTELSFPAGDWFNAKIGGRYERTEINSFFSNAPLQRITPGYNTFVPSVFLSKQISEKHTVKLSYSKRIERPDHEDLDPFINTSDPKNISAGNPYLQPEIGNRFELSYVTQSKDRGLFMLTAFYRVNNHDIQPYIVFYPLYKVGDSVYNNVTVSTPQNIGLEKNVGLNFYSDLHFSSKFNLRTNLFLFYRHILNALNPGLDNRSFNYRLHTNASYNFKNDYAAEFFGHFNSARHEVQGSYPSFFSYSLALRKQFWNKKASLALTATNPFNKYIIQPTSLSGPDFEVRNLRKIPFRSIGINFSWRFGLLEFKEEKNNNPDTNLSAPSGL